MTDTAHALRELHRIHRQLSDLKERLERGPKQVRAREAAVARLQQVLAQAQAEVKAQRVASDQKQLSLKSGEDKIKNLKVKLNQANNNREYQALRDQIAADEMANSVLSDEILEAMDKIEEVKKSVVAAEEELAKGKAELEKARVQAQAEAERLRGEVARVEAELAASETRLPEVIRADYDRIMKSKGSDGMAPVEAEACGGCYQHITPNMLNDLKLSRMVFCKGCGRLLYLPETPVRAGQA